MSVQSENFEEIINLPVGSKASRLDVTSENQEIPLKPILAFNDEGTRGPLPQVDGVQTQQTAGEPILSYSVWPSELIPKRGGMVVLFFEGTRKPL